jgi:hypothetical protein
MTSASSQYLGRASASPAQRLAAAAGAAVHIVLRHFRRLRCKHQRLMIPAAACADAWCYRSAGRFQADFMRCICGLLAFRMDRDGGLGDDYVDTET